MHTSELTRRNTLIALFLATIMSFTLLAGCSAGEESSSSSDQSASAQSSESTETGLVIGDSSGSARSLIVTNDLGADITFISIATVGQQDEPTALAIPGGKWANGEKATVYYGKGDSRSTYELTITAGEKMYTLHSLTLSSIDEASLRTDGTFAYITYTSGNTTISTLGTEKSLAAAANGEAEQPAPEPAVEEDDESYYYYPYYYDEYYYDEDYDSDDYDDYDEEYYDDSYDDTYYEEYDSYNE